MLKLRLASMLMLSLLAGMLSACGFEPLYGTTPVGSSTARELSRITVEEQKTRLGQLVRNKLLSSMSPGGTVEEHYRLRLVATSETETAVDDADDLVRRAVLKVDVAYELSDPASARVLHTGKTFSRIAYDRNDADYSNVQAETNAMEKAADEVGTDIRTRLAAYFASAK